MPERDLQFWQDLIGYDNLWNKNVGDGVNRISIKKHAITWEMHRKIVDALIAKGITDSQIQQDILTALGIGNPDVINFGAWTDLQLDITQLELKLSIDTLQWQAKQMIDQMKYNNMLISWLEHDIDIIEKYLNDNSDRYYRHFNIHEPRGVYAGTGSACETAAFVRGYKYANVLRDILYVNKHAIMDANYEMMMKGKEMLSEAQQKMLLSVKYTLSDVATLEWYHAARRREIAFIRKKNLEAEVAGSLFGKLWLAQQSIILHGFTQKNVTEWLIEYPVTPLPLVSILEYSRGNKVDAAAYGFLSFLFGMMPAASFVERISVKAVPSQVGVAGVTISPGIGRSRFRSQAEFAEAAFKRYQQFYEDGYALTMRRVEQGLVRNERLVIGSEVDAFARLRMRRWLSSEGIEEGAGRLIAVNRRLYDPMGSGKYRQPDIYIPGARLIFDGTIGEKTCTTRQILDFRRFSGRANIIIVRPTAEGGSYGLVFR